MFSTILVQNTVFSQSLDFRGQWRWYDLPKTKSMEPNVPLDLVLSPSGTIYPNLSCFHALRCLADLEEHLFENSRCE